MIGRATLFWIVLALAVGVGLFHVKYEVQALEEELARLNHDIVEGQQQIHVLRAEWAHLTRPGRLEELNARHLGLAPLAPGQVGTVGTLPVRPAVADGGPEAEPRP